MKKIILLILISTINNLDSLAQSKLLPLFNTQTQSFEGTPIEQAKYLLAPVKKYAKIGENLAALPPVLEQLLSENLIIDKQKLKTYLANNQIAENTIGGNIDETVSKTQKGKLAKYFVIHDTSTPNYGQFAIPNNIDSANWKPTLLKIYKNEPKKSAHIFIDRMGNSITQNNLKTPWRATKLELKAIGVASRGLFLHVELIQPRKADPNKVNDAIAPMPGFSQAQLKRLALLYIVASVRKGQWLIPTYHAVLDNGLSDGHDDPQNFDLNDWGSILSTLIQNINQ
ncbi:hypothetical protein [Emticicia sp. SJ17W-69]|uniref:hypothetical protein n=1 Tax=Emticicia sp. SJ17W-69 TaxID=3421657 RepID=UPI003EBC7590